MSTKKSWVLGSVLAGVLNAAASAPVAMRVELEPLRQVGDATQVAVVVQVSPEDRIRIGSNAIVRIELDGGTVSSGSPMRAVRLEDDGSTRVVVEWPPGEHHLRVEIEDPSKEDTGLWVGTVRIPDLSPSATVEEVLEPEPESSGILNALEADSKDEIDPSMGAAAAPIVVELPASESSPKPAPEAENSEDAEGVAETTLDSPAVEIPVAAGLATAGAVAMAEVPEPEMEEGPVEIDPSDPGPMAVVESMPEEPPFLESAPATDQPDTEAVVPEAEGETATVEELPEAPPIEAPAEPGNEQPLVEPLRADPPSQSAEPDAVAPRQPAEPADPAPVGVPVSDELAAHYHEWERADPDTREFSLIVTRGREPAVDVEGNALSLRVGGTQVAVERLGNAENAPLLLGFTIDVAADEVGGWSGSRGSLAPIVERTAGGRGRLFVATPDGVGAWEGEPEVPGRAADPRMPNNVAGLVMASIERFKGLRGRTFLVVLTDGRNEPTKDEWQRATEAAGSAGVPILVVALWDERFNHRTRKNLKKLTDVSGGSLFLVQGSTQLESAADRFGRYLDGGYSLRFRSPLGEQQKATSISVTSPDRDLDISAPKSIR